MSPIRILLLTCAASSLLAACATDGAPPPQAAAPPPAPPKAEDIDIPSGVSSAGLYLAGRAALYDGRTDRAYAYFDRVREAEGGDFMRGRAFNAALLAGDVTRAASLAPDAPGDDTAMYRLGQLTKLVEAMSAGDTAGARAIAATDAIGYPYKSAGALLTPWVAAMAGDVEGSVKRPSLRGDRLADIFGQWGQALLLERAKRYKEAEETFKALNSLGGAGGLFVLDYGAFLERRGRRAEAIALYDNALKAEPGDAELLAARTRAAGRKPAPAMLTPRQGAAKVLTAPAAAVRAEGKGQLSLAYLRLVLRLDPQRYDAWVLTGDVLEASGDVGAARAAYLRVPMAATEAVGARGKLAWSYQNADDGKTALALARETAAAHPGNQAAQVGLVDILRANHLDAEAVTVADALVKKAGPAADWRLLYLRATALDAAGRWPEAEADLQAALARDPANGQLLNYLGYSWIDRGEKLEQAVSMVQKAALANPRSGAILDSLGWGYYRLGDYKRAVETLEAAVELEPGDPDVNNHLGDAYWQVGRRNEARFQWQRVLTLDPEEKTKADAEAKLKDGPPAQPGAAAAPRP